MIHRGLKWILLIALLACVHSSGQSRVFDATNLGAPAELSDGWLVHAGDDPAYARPDFDDSKWAPFNTDFKAQSDDLQKLFPNQRSGVVWFRLHVKVNADRTRLALLASYISSAYEIYVNGTKLISVGRVAPYQYTNTFARLIAALPQNQTSSGFIVIAARAYFDPYFWRFPYAGMRGGNIVLGEESSVYDGLWLLLIGGQAINCLEILAQVVALIGALLLFSTQRNRHEYLWLSLWMVSVLPGNLLFTLSNFIAYNNYWNIILVASWTLYPYPMARMYCAFIGHRAGWKLNLFLAFTCLSNAIWLSARYLHLFSGPFQILAGLLLAVLEVAVLPCLMLAQFRQGKRAEIVLLLPLLLDGLWRVAGVGTVFFMQLLAFGGFFWKVLPHLGASQLGPLILPHEQILEILSILSLALIILVRSNRASRQQALLEGEIANAREIQQVILPDAVEAIPGFHIESDYLPAREVGGDFFQILPVGKDGALLVLGDVAGKGLPAAMLVSLLVGTIRTAAEETTAPELVLKKMNSRMVGRSKGGFSTALAALFEADGSVTIANAGHLPPYLDGREIELAGSLPLGIVDNARYEPVRFSLALGDRLTFYSDGIIEAQNKDRELFGFDRARELSTQSAAAIAEAAKAFGQEDDITVVCIQRVQVAENRPVEVLSAAPAPAI